MEDNLSETVKETKSKGRLLERDTHTKENSWKKKQRKKEKKRKKKEVRRSKNEREKERVEKNLEKSKSEECQGLKVRKTGLN